MKFKRQNLFLLLSLFLSLILGNSVSVASESAANRLAYIMPDNKIPFWEIMGRGIQSSAKHLGYEVDIYSAQHNAQYEIQSLAQAIKDNVSGIIISPINSSTCVTILKLANKAKIPVVISDIGTEHGEYVSYISSNNKDGAYLTGQLLIQRLLEQNVNEGSIGIIAIPQRRLNGQERTAGFMQAIKDSKLTSAGIKQLIKWDDHETYVFTKDMIKSHPNLRALWLQTSNIYKGALRALMESGKQNEVLLATYDAEPEFIELIENGTIISSAMQQPYLMGMHSVQAMDAHLKDKPVEKQIQVPTLIISSDNLTDQLPTIKKMVLGFE